MSRMVSFRLNRECREVAVNAEAVLYVCHYEKGASSLHFGKDCFIRVQGDVADVVARLGNAGLAPLQDHRDDRRSAKPN